MTYQTDKRPSPLSLQLPENGYAMLLLLVAIMLIFSGLGLRDPWPADEPRFAQVAKEMVETGQWFFPARAEEFYPDKPPLFMWAIALFYAITGSLKIAFLLPSALCSLLTLYLVFDIGRKLWDANTGLLAGFLLLFSFQFTLQAKTAQIDAMVCCWITLGCYGLLRFLLYDGLWRWYWLSFFFMGIGVITKGVGFLPLFMLLPYWIYRLQKKPSVPVQLHRENGLKWLSGPVVMLLAISLWFAPMLWIVEHSHNPLFEQYRDNILFRQTVTRYADSWHHIKPFWYYLVSVIPLFWLPLSLALPWLIPTWWRAIKQGDARIWLPVGWILLVILFFSLSPGKRGVYVLPALPMLALICAPYANQLRHNKRFGWLVWGVVALLGTLIFLMGLAGMAELKFAIKLQDKFEISPWRFFVVTGAFGLLAAWRFRRHRRWVSWPVFMAVLWSLYSTWGYVLLNEVKTPKGVFEEVKKYTDDKAQLGLVDFSEQFILFSPYPVTHFGFHTPNEEQVKSAYQWLNEGADRYLLLGEDLFKLNCFDKDKAKPLGFAHRTNWFLLDRSARLGACGQPAPDTREYHYTPVH